MKDKTRLGINLKIASATSVVLFTLLTVFVGTYTWFQAIKNVDNANDDIKIEKLNSTVSGFSIHKFLGSTKTENDTIWRFNPIPTYDYVFDGQGTASGKIAMGEFTLDNPDHPILLIFSVSGTYEQIKAFAYEDYITSSPLTSDTGHPLSSVIETYSLTFASNPRTNGIETSPTDLYEDDDTKHEHPLSSREYIPISSSVKNNNKGSFFNIDSHNSVTFDSETYFFNGDVTNKTHIGVIMNYNLESLIYISSTFLGNDYLLNGLSFTNCDIGLKV